MLRFGSRKFLQPLADALSLAIQLARLARQHLPHDAAHLIANFRVAPRLGRLPLQRAKLLFHFHDDIVDAVEIDLRGFELRFRQPLLRLEFRDAGSLFDDRSPLVRLGR